MTFRPRIVALQTNKEFRWLGRVIVPGFFDGEHRFAIQDNGDGTITFTQAEKFTGVLVPLLLPLIERVIKVGCETMNQKLKEKCEKNHY